METEQEIAREIEKLPKQSSLKEEEVPTNLKCSCGRAIAPDHIYYIRIESGEAPEAFCDYCVSLT